MSVDSFTVEKFRKTHESKSDWRHRRAFLIGNHEYIPDEEKLVCLANCYVNVHCYGCSYPDEVMKELDELESNVDRRDTWDLHEERKLAKVKRKQKKVEKEKEEEKNLQEIELKKSQLKISEAEILQLNNKFIKLKSNLAEFLSKSDNIIFQLHIAFDKSRMLVEPRFSSLPKKIFKCELFVDSVFLSEGEAGNKKDSKEEAFRKALFLLQMPSTKIIQDEEREGLMLVSEGVARGDRDSSLQEANCFENPISDLKFFHIFFNFVLLEHLNLKSSAKSILSSSAVFNKVTLTTKSHPLPDGSVRFEIFLNNFLISFNSSLSSLFCSSSSSSSSQPEVTTLAYESAIERIRKFCPSIKIIKSYDASDDEIITKQNVAMVTRKLSSKASLATDIMSAVVPDSNIGKILMKKMGWKGGGLGKEGNKGVEKLEFEERFNGKEGLGSEKEIKKDLEKELKELISMYVYSEEGHDLIFSKNFSKEERALLHKLVEKYNLKSKSHGKNDERFLVIGRKRTANQLLDWIRSQNNHTHKYILKEPMTGIL